MNAALNRGAMPLFIQFGGGIGPPKHAGKPRPVVVMAAGGDLESDVVPVTPGVLSASSSS